MPSKALPVLPPDFWQKERDHLIAEILPRIQLMAQIGAAAQADELTRLGIFFDPELFNVHAAEWARLHTDDLLAQFKTTNSRIVGEMLATWTETPGATMADLNRSLMQGLGVNTGRANRIAVTEATRALAAGEALALEQSGTAKALFLPPAHVYCRCGVGPRRLRTGEMVVVWYTNHDDIVCKSPITVPWQSEKVLGCRALHTVIVSEGQWLGMKFADADK